MNPQNDFVTNAAKNWLRSKGVMGSTGAALLGIALTYQLTGEVSQTEAVELVALVISAGIGLWGRIVAKRPVKLK